MPRKRRLCNIPELIRLCVLVVSFATSVSTVALGQDGPTTIAQEAPAVRYAQNIAGATETANGFRDEYARMAAELQWKQEGTLSEDLAKAKEVYDGLIAKFEGAVKAWSDGDDAEAQKLVASARALMSAKDVWRRRIYEYRQAQADAAPTQQWYTETAATVRPGAVAAFQQLVEAKKAASEAWRDVAEAALPDAPPEVIEELKEKAFAAIGEVDVALWRYSWANDLEGLWSEKTVSPEDVAEPLAKLQAAQDKLVALRRKLVEHERSVRQTYADIAKRQNELFQAFGAAREAKVRAAEAAAADDVSKK
jgi:hypothetical protein